VQIGHTTTLFEVPISRLDLASAVEECASVIASKRGGYACFVNVHSLTESTRQPALRESLRGATYCFADGLPLVWLANGRGAPIAGRTAGPDFMPALIERTRGLRHGFIGGEGLGEHIAATYGLDAAVYAPPRRMFSREHALADWEAFRARCAGVLPGLVWVGLGAPKQEQWMATVAPHAPGVMFFGVGAAFDVLAGTQPRAPAWMRTHGLEWLYRLSREPRRLVLRYAVTNTRFIAHAARDHLFGTKK
jgi:N-acetylglucosaminyldiphosphoundecaprenol N-acetyl-beta-D-mannosaminyltransferase